MDVYLSLLVLIHLLDKNKGEEALHCANMLMAKIDSQNRYIEWTASVDPLDPPPLPPPPKYLELDSVEDVYPGS